MRRPGPKLLAAALLAATLVVGMQSAGSTAPSPTGAQNGRIVFTRCRARCQLYTVNPDGTALRRIRTEGDAFFADWSPDGEQIVYVSTESGDTTLWILNADGTGARQLTPDDPDTDDLWPRFTPNGRRVLFTSCLGDDCDGGIGSVRTDGTHLHLVTPHSGDSYNVADPSPGGGRMAYMRHHVDGVKSAIYVSRADGSDELRVSPPRLQGWLPDWRPTGGQIMFSSQVFFDRPAPALYTVRPNGQGLEPLTQPPHLHSDWFGSYSPDGTKVVFNSDRRYDDLCCGDLFTIEPGQRNMQRIPLPFDAYEPRWGTAPLLAPDPALDARVAPGLGGPPCEAVAEIADTPVCP